jgi:hypothetical protein
VTTLVNPILFSQRFNVRPSDLDAAGLIDPILNSDTKLFIDPLLLSHSAHTRVNTDAFKLLTTRFEEIIRLVAASAAPGDKAWRTAAQKLDLRERRETGLGYGGASTRGSSRPDSIRQQVLSTAREIIELGEKDPQIISLMGLFEEGVGPDTISDLTTNIILPVLCSITEDFCRAHSVPIRSFQRLENAQLPPNPFGHTTPIILVPKDILRELPLATDWSDISRVVFEIEEIREAFNRFLGPLAQATLSQRKRALRKTLLQSLEIFRLAFEEILAASDSYDPNDDTLNFYAFRKLLTSDLSGFAHTITAPSSPSKEELARVVHEIIEHFRYLVENNNLWELLWVNGKPKKERAAQLLFFAVADVFCKANNIDISPETHCGGGPVDFKFATGYDNRIVVEVKRSIGTVEHGYRKQLEIYKAAARTDEAVFMVIDVGNTGQKLRNIQALRRELLRQGKKASRIEVVDAMPRESASKA